MKNGKRKMTNNNIPKYKKTALKGCFFNAGIIGLELSVIGNYKAFLTIRPCSGFEAPRSHFQRVNETNETRDSYCLILKNKTV